MVPGSPASQMRARTIRREAEPRSDDAAATTPARPAFGRRRSSSCAGAMPMAACAQLVADRAQVRPVLGALAAALLSGRGFEPLGFRCLGDWSRERLGVGARAVREWARVWRALEELPLLREAVLSSKVCWTVARMIVGIVTPENEAACLETVRGRTVRAVGALLRAVAPGDENRGEQPEEDRVAVRVACSPRVATKWAAALELARRMGGEELAASECAEAIAAECVSAVGPPEVLGSARHRPPLPARRAKEKGESGLRAEVWPRLRWNAPASRKIDRLARLVCGLEDCSPRELRPPPARGHGVPPAGGLRDRRSLRQVLERKLYRERRFRELREAMSRKGSISAAHGAQARAPGPGGARGARSGQCVPRRAHHAASGGGAAAGRARRGPRITRADAAGDVAAARGRGLAAAGGVLGAPRGSGALRDAGGARGARGDAGSCHRHVARGGRAVR